MTQTDVVQVSCGTMDQSARSGIMPPGVEAHRRVLVSAYDRYCREAAARFVSFQPDKDALMAQARNWLQQACQARSLSLETERGSDVLATLGPPFHLRHWP